MCPCHFFVHLKELMSGQMTIMKELTRTHPNWLLDILNSLIILNSIIGSLQPFPTSRQFGKL